MAKIIFSFWGHPTFIVPTNEASGSIIVPSGT